MIKYFSLVPVILTLSVQKRGARPEERTTTTDVNLYDFTQTTTASTEPSISWILYAFVLPICFALLVLMIKLLYRSNHTSKKVEEETPIQNTNIYSCYSYVKIPVQNNTETTWNEEEIHRFSMLRNPNYQNIVSLKAYKQ